MRFKHAEEQARKCQRIEHYLLMELQTRFSLSEKCSLSLPTQSPSKCGFSFLLTQTWQKVSFSFLIRKAAVVSQVRMLTGPCPLCQGHCNNPDNLCPGQWVLRRAWAQDGPEMSGPQVFIASCDFLLSWFRWKSDTIRKAKWQHNGHWATSVPFNLPSTMGFGSRWVAHKEWDRPLEAWMEEAWGLPDRQGSSTRLTNILLHKWPGLQLIQSPHLLKWGQRCHQPWCESGVTPGKTQLAHG